MESLQKEDEWEETNVVEEWKDLRERENARIYLRCIHVIEIFGSGSGRRYALMHSRTVVVTSIT